MRLFRHDLLEVAPDAWTAAIATLDLPADASRLVEGWCRRGWPVIVRRRLAGEALPVALQLPNAAGRLRVATSVPVDAVTPRAPVFLAAAAASSPAEWNETVSSLLDFAADFGAPTVYGGLLWQHVTGEQVLRPTSDLDLLWRPEPPRRRALLDALADLDGGALRVDGEIVLEDGGGVSWRELRAAAEGRAASVAVKSMDGVTLREAAPMLRETVPC